jgi:preprotein translocase subunit SecF
LTGGVVIHDFAFAMLWGVFVGSYSSIFVAAPIIYEWQTHKKSKSGGAMKVNPKLVNKKA